MNVLYFKSKEDGSIKGAELIIEGIKQNKNLVLGLATGSTPEQMYNYITSNYKNKDVSFKDVKTFNLDEYVGLKNEDENQSYRYFMDKNLFNHIDINKENINFPINFSETNLKPDYSYYDELIAKAGGIDIQILGIGNNGHIAFNEPGSKIGSKTRLIDLAESTIQANSRFFKDINDVPKKAVSMGIDTIIKAKKIILLAFGDSKKEALTKLIYAKSYDENWPCTALWNHKDLTIITDIEF